jgi:chromosome segregation ATPase
MFGINETQPSHDVTNTALTKVDLFGAKPAPPKILLEQLMDAHYEMVQSGGTQEEIAEIVDLIVTLDDVTKKANARLEASHARHIASLSARRDELCRACRTAEVAVTAARDDHAILQNQAFPRQQRMQEARTALAQIPPINSRFPTDDEISARNAQVAAAQVRLDAEEYALQELRQRIEAARIAHATAAQKLVELTEQLRAADSELNTARGITK